MKRLGAVGLGFLAALVCLELLVRMAGWISVARQQAHNRRAAVKGEYRILCLGESTTAQGVGPFDAIWPGQLQNILNRQKLGVIFRVINEGKIAVNTTSILAEVPNYLRRYDPQMVISMMGINDEAVQYYRGIPDSTGFLFRHWRTYRLFDLLWAKNEENHSSPSAIPSGMEASWRQEKFPSPAIQAYCNQANSLMATGRQREAAELLSKVADENPACAPVVLRLKRYLYGLEEFDRAEQVMRRAVEAAPGDPDLVAGQAELYTDEFLYAQSNAGRGARPWNNPRAQTVIESALARGVVNAAMYFQLGRAYWLDNVYDKSAAAYEKALEQDPDDMAAVEDLCAVYARVGRLDLKRTALESAVQRGACTQKLYVELAWLYHDAGQLDLCRALLTRMRAKFSHLNDWSAALDGVMGEKGEGSFFAASRMTVRNYCALKDLLASRGVPLVAVQYPLRDAQFLERTLSPDWKHVLVVDSRDVFVQALRNGKYSEYFTDHFAGDFGHCTPKGYELLARNIAASILRYCFGARLTDS